MISYAREHVEIDQYYLKLKRTSIHFEISSEMLVSSTLHNQQIVNSLIPQEFSEFIKEKMNERESKYVEKRNMKLEVLPEFHQLFEETTTISSKKF